MAAANQAVGEARGRVLDVALAALAAITGLAFGRVFRGTWPGVRLAIAGALAVGVAVLLRRRHLGLSLLVGILALVEVVALFVFPGTTWAGLPTGDTFRALWSALGQVSERAAKEIAPAPAVPALMIASLTSVWAAATASHALAARSRTSVLPLLPPAALLAFAGVVADDGSRPGYVVAFLACAFAVLFGQALMRARFWGPALLPGARLRTSGSGRSARLLAAGAIIVALALPGMLPGFGAEAIIRLNRPNSTVAISPIVDIRPNLLQNPPAELFSVEANRASYWRLVTLDRFDGRLWTSSDLDAGEGQEVVGFDPIQGFRPAGHVEVHQVFDIGELSQRWAPAANDPVIFQLGPRTGRYDDETGILALDEQTDEDMRYEVTSLAPAPPQDRLNREELLGPVSPRYTALPAHVPARVYGLAHDLTAHEPTPFRKILAIQEFLRTFTYDEKAPAGHGVDAIVFFLTQSQRGYCEQFAGTMAVMVRALGYPSRVAIGFLPGDRDRSGRYRVTTEHVHAWTEVFFPDYGWLAFEPTPTRTNPSAGYLTLAPTGPRPDANLAPGGGGLTAPPVDRGRARRDAAEIANALRAVGPGAAPPAGPRDQRAPMGPLLPWALLLAAGLMLLVPPAKAAARRVALSRRRGPPERVVAAYRVFQAGAADLGLGRRPGETLWEYRSRLRDHAEFTDGHLERLTTLTGRALYAADGIGSGDAEPAAEAARAALRGLRRHAGTVRTAAGAFRPSRPLG